MSSETETFTEWEGMVDKLTALKEARRKNPDDKRLRDQLRLHKMLMEQERDYWRLIGQACGTRKYIVGGDAVLEEGN